MPKEYSFRDPVHPIEHLTIRGEDDGQRQVGFVDPSGVIDNRTNRGMSSVEPAVFVDLPDAVDRHLLDGKATRGLPDALDVPGSLTECNPVA